MTQPLQPISITAMLNGTGALSPIPLQKAFSMKASLASTAASQAMLGQAGSAMPASLAQAAIARTTAGTAAGSDGISLSPKSLNPLNGPKTHTDAELQKVSKNFEAIFLNMLMKEMRNSVQKSNLMGDSKTMEFFESMRDEQMSEQMSEKGGIGLGKLIYNKLKQVTEPHLKTFS